MTNDLVSIVMLCYNGGRFVEETVRSVLNQTYQYWELLFVDEHGYAFSFTKYGLIDGTSKLKVYSFTR